jgi:hypothetical protein
VGGGRDALAFPIGKTMRKRRQKRRGFSRRLISIRTRPAQRHFAEEDPPLFDEREMEFTGMGDEKVIPPES